MSFCRIRVTGFLFTLLMILFLMSAKTTYAAKVGEFKLFNDSDMESIIADGFTTLVDSDAFTAGAVCAASVNGTGTSISYKVDANIDTTDLLLLRFSAYALVRCGKIEVKVGQDAYCGHFALPVEKTDYFLPVSGVTNVDAITIKLTTEDQQVYFGNFELVNYKDTPVTKLKTGMYNSICKSKTAFTEDQAKGEEAAALITDDAYLYAVQAGKLTVYSIKDAQSPKEVAALTGLGNTRDVDFCANGQGLIITSRENGVYIVDISDPLNPSVISNFPSLDMATGVAVSGQYMFICSRYYGVEIYDITNLTAPIRCSVVSNKEEYYDCCVSNGYLYVSAWAERTVEIYDLSNVSYPKHVSTILLNGQGGGLVVENNILYVATGYNSRDSRETTTSAGYGMGNGMEIYDVSDPINPHWLSTSNIDGRYQNSGYDHWKVKVTGNYAFYSSTFTGVYIYDVSDPSAPKRVDWLSVYIPNTSDKYHKIAQGKYILPYDTLLYAQGPIMGIAMTDGCLYISDVYTGIYVYRGSWIKKEDRDGDGELLRSDRIMKETPRVDRYTVTGYHGADSTFAAVSEGGLIYVACGMEGVHVLDADLNLLEKFPTQGAAVDIIEHGDYLYVAENNAGMSIYHVTQDGLVKLATWTYDAYNLAVSDLMVTMDGKYVLAQIGFTRLAIIDVSDPANPKLTSVYNTGSMYYRNLCTGIMADQYIGVYDNTNQWWFDQSKLTIAEPVKLPNPFASQPNGCAARGDLVLAIYKNGYVYYDLSVTSIEAFADLPVHVVSEKIKLKGKPSIGGNLLVVSFGYGKQVTLVDITDLQNPRLIDQFTLDGYPDVATITPDYILIPQRAGGLLKLKPD